MRGSQRKNIVSSIRISLWEWFLVSKRRRDFLKKCIRFNQDPRARLERPLVPMDSVDNGHFSKDSVSISCNTLMSQTGSGCRIKYWIRTNKVWGWGL